MTKFRPGALFLILCLSLAFQSSAVAQPVITVTPEAPLVDQALDMRVEGLAPDSIATLILQAVDADEQAFTAYATFQADGAGLIDLSETRPLSGTYDTIDPMGLFWSMTVAGDRYQRAGFSLGGGNEIAMELSVQVDREVQASTMISRLLRAPDVTISDVQEGGLYGRLFRPGGLEGERPAVIVMGGSEGGVDSAVMQAQLLASRGYVALALGYFAFDGEGDLPSSLQDLPLEYFDGAVDWLAAQPFVDGDRIALLGGSKGAEAALLTAAYFDNVAAVIAIAPTSHVWAAPFASDDQSSWSLDGEPLAFVPYRNDPTYNPPSGFPNELYRHYGFALETLADSDSAIPIERTTAAVLLIAGMDDRIWPSAEMSRRLIARADAYGARSNVTSFTYPNAGHSFNAARLPTSWTPTEWRRWPNGGTAAGNAAAHAAAWQAILDFLEAM
ncbi:acyl-CoA thioester hydrolase/BAAT C-terminal domain-containing protein [Maricaulis parjimensis]|uniref:acyl-CoA thioester hydrolase/BAAT C-terminal domain-containing protein n=1 Tax=Maricaulis parjimensis TaxID=144023 RepID=UPI0019398A21|nr:acyl-CoA thioester hydrolase/BAAT C-terminal domain-containing protein [Maricaulis parjimensis]